MKNSTQTTTPLLTATIKLAPNIFLLNAQKKPSWPIRDLLNRKSYANHAEINILLTQKTTQAQNHLTPIVDLSCTSTSNIYLYTLLISYFYIFNLLAIISITNAQTHSYHYSIPCSYTVILSLPYRYRSVPVLDRTVPFHWTIVQQTIIVRKLNEYLNLKFSI